MSPKLSQVLARCVSAGAFRWGGRYALYWCGRGGIDEVLAIAKANDDVWASVGLHPQSAEQDLSWIEEKLRACDDVVAVGETGLDYKTAVEVNEQHRQLAASSIKCSWLNSMDYRLLFTPATQSRTPWRCSNGILTSREFCIASLSHGVWQKSPRYGVLHFHLIVTFANAENVRIVARQVPEDRLLIETDAPWLACPYRGKENEPAFVETAKFIAQLQDESLEELAAYTSENFRRLFLSADVEQKFKIVVNLWIETSALAWSV